jgi:hypothetical protein
MISREVQTGTVYGQTRYITTTTKLDDIPGDEKSDGGNHVSTVFPHGFLNLQQRAALARG